MEIEGHSLNRVLRAEIEPVLKHGFEVVLLAIRMS